MKKRRAIITSLVLACVVLSVIFVLDAMTSAPAKEQSGITIRSSEITEIGKVVTFETSTGIYCVYVQPTPESTPVMQC